VQNKNPFGFVNSTSVIQGNVASFSLKPHGSEEETLVSNLSIPVQIKIPTTVSGSTCRRQSGGCRYYDTAIGDWSTEGMFERERTQDYILCEAVHLSTFAVSADDIVPEFNLPNPDADLFANISLENALAIFVVAFILFGYGILNFLGYKKDCRDRAKKRLMEKISTVDSRFSGNGLEFEKGVLRPPSAAIGGALTAAQRKEMGKQTNQELLSEAFREEHNVISIFEVKPGDDFTRPQRLTVLLSIILGQIAISAVFFGIDASNMAMKIVIGVVSAIVLAPSKFAFKILFKKSVSRPTPKRKISKPKTRRQLELSKLEASKRWDNAKGTISIVNAFRMGKNALGIPPNIPRPESPRLADPDDKPLSTFTPPLPSIGPPVGRPQRRSVMRSHVNSITTFVPPPPAAPNGVRMRPRRRSRSVTPAGSTASFSSSFTPPLPPPPEDLTPGQVSRPQRSRSGRPDNALVPHLAGGPLPPPPPPPSDKPMRPRRKTRSRPGSASTDASGSIVAEQQAIAVTGSPFMVLAKPGEYLPPPPPAPPSAGAMVRPARSKARAAMLASVGMQKFAQTHATGTPPPPPSDGEASGNGRPRHLRRTLSAGGSSSSTYSQASSSSSSRPLVPVGAWAMQPSPANTKLKGKRRLARPGAGRAASRASPFKLASAQAVSSLVLAQSEHAPRADIPDGQIVLSSQRPMGPHEGQLEGNYVPDSISTVVIKIQRAWRRFAGARRMLHHQNAIEIQRVWRGFMVRKNLAAAVIIQEKGRSVQGLWWVNAHKHLTPKEKPRIGGVPSAEEDQQVLNTWSGLMRKPSMPVLGTAFDVLHGVARDKRREMKSNKDLVEQRRRKKMRERRAKQKKGLPRWFIYVAYFFSFTFCAFCSLLIMMFGLFFEPAVARAWLLSSIFSLAIEFFIQDPVKLAAMKVLKTRLKNEWNEAKQRKLDLLNTKRRGRKKLG